MNIEKELKLKDFKDIKLIENDLTFSKGIRSFKINLLTKEIKMDFDFLKFMEDNYEKKTRHSVSYSDKLYGSDIEEACKKLNWKINKGPIQIFEERNWKTSLYFDVITEVLIGEVPHIILDNEVFRGSIDEIMYLGSINAKDIIPASVISYIKSSN